MRDVHAGEDSMSDTPSSDTRGGRISTITSSLALAVSVFALAIGAWQTKLMQGQARASVWPHLAIGYTYNSNVDEDGFFWRVDNNGVGPARVQSATMTLDGKPMQHWNDVLVALGFDGKRRISTSSLNGEVIPPSLNRETAIDMIRINEKEIAAAMKANATHFEFAVCYCSVYDDCWVARWQRNDVESVEKCEVPATPFLD
jgi:hypothetical protein